MTLDAFGHPRFQSTLPVWGATVYPAKKGKDVMEFQSTLPVWGATNIIKTKWLRKLEISIHAPRVGSDSKIAQFFACNFAQK